MERIEKIESQELKDLLTALKEADTKIVSLVKESEERQQEFDKETMLRQKIVDQMKPIVEGIFEGKLAEFELLSNITLDEAGEIEVKIMDELETWKEKRREAKVMKVQTEAEVQEPLAIDTEK